MIYDSITLQQRNGPEAEAEQRETWLYVKMVYTRQSEPIRSIYWYPVSKECFYQLLPLTLTLVGKPLYAGPSTGKTHLPDYYTVQPDGAGEHIVLAQGNQTPYTFHKAEPIPPPVLSGRSRGMLIQWREGEWQKRTSRGWKRV